MIFFQLSFRRVLLVLGALLLVSCANKATVRLEKLAKPAEQGNYVAAVEAVRKGQSSLYGSNSEYLYEFDLGLLFHYQGQWDSSIVHLAKAEQILEDLYALSVSNEALAILTNDNARPYRSRPYEEVWMQEMQILNYLAKGDRDGALVQVRRSQIAMQALQQKDNEKYHDDGAIRYISALAYEQGGASDDALISYFKTLEAYQQGNVSLPAQVHAVSWYNLRTGGRESDLAAVGFGAPASEAEAERLAQAGQEIVVVGYAGRGPVLDELRFWGTYVRDGLLVFHYKDPETGKEITDAWPAPGLPSGELAKAEKGQSSQSGTTLHINFAIPQMARRSSVSETFAVRVNSEYKGRTEAIADVQDLLARNLSEDRTAVITRTVIRVALRTIAAQTAKNQMQTDNPWVNLLTNVGADILADQLEEADLRVGLFLPRTLQMVRIPVAPGSHAVTVDVLDPSGRKIGEQAFEGVQVRKGQKTFLFVPSLR